MGSSPNSTTESADWNNPEIGLKELKESKDKNKVQVANFGVCFYVTLLMQTVPTDLKQDYTSSLTNTLKQRQ